MRRFHRIMLSLAAVVLVAGGEALAAQSPEAHVAGAAIQPSQALAARIDELVAILSGGGDYDTYFSAAFRQQVPRATFTALLAQIDGQLGKPTGIESIAAEAPNSATITVGYERGVATMQIVVDDAEPHVVTGLLITGTAPRDDSRAAIEAGFRALPGQSGFGIYALDTGMTPIAGINDRTVAPLGSAFKLWVLAELAREITAGQRKWSDVVTLSDRRSLPSGMTQNWPRGAPVTLQTLATLMISISDNSATDTLIETLGRAPIEAMIAATGASDPARNQPLLTTREAFALKAMKDSPLVSGWASATPAARRAGMASAAIDAARPTIGMFGGAPLAQQIEWFGSPADEARVLDWLRRHGDATTMAILAINPATSLNGRFAYIGFKGGSEPGVLSLNYLVRTKGGKWYAATGNWHRPDREVETLTFTSLMTRALTLIPPE